MKLKLATMLLLAFTLAPASFAQSDSGVKQDTKDAAQSTGRAAKKTGHKIKKGTKKVVHKGAHATSKGANKVEDKTRPSPSPTPSRFGKEGFQSDCSCMRVRPLAGGTEANRRMEARSSRQELNSSLLRCYFD
jgi:hypothetical protein